MTRNPEVTADPKSWKDKMSFKLYCDGDDEKFIQIEFSHFIEPNVPFIKRIISNMFLESLSMPILGFSHDSSKNSKSPDMETFIRKIIGLAIFKIKDEKVATKLECAHID